MSKIICGVSELDGARWEGKTISQIRHELRDVLNIPERATVLLNADSEAADSDSVFDEDDELEFVKSAGEKGPAQPGFMAQAAGDARKFVSAS